MTEKSYKRAQEIEKEIKYIKETLCLISSPYDYLNNEHRSGGIWIGDCRERTTVYTGWFDTEDDEFYHLINDWLKKRIKKLKTEFESL